MFKYRLHVGSLNVLVPTETPSTLLGPGSGYVMVFTACHFAYVNRTTYVTEVHVLPSCIMSVNDYYNNYVE